MANKEPCPCETCMTRPDTENCDNKRCLRWSTWWIAQWEQLRKKLLKEG